MLSRKVTSRGKGAEGEGGVVQCVGAWVGRAEGRRVVGFA